MNILQLECFLTLAQTLNYTKASKQLHMTQPNLSKMIVNLEQEVGAQLLQRSKRDVRLTATGSVFYQEIAKTMRSYYHALERTRRVVSGQSGAINLGFLGTAVIKLLPPIINQFRALYPLININLMDYTYSPLIDALADNRVDLAVLPDRELDGIPHIDRKYLYSDGMCVAVHADHPMADREQVDLWELKDELFVLMDPAVSVRDRDLVVNMCLDQDFLPRVAYEANSLINLLMMVECRIGVAILASHMQRFASNSVKLVRLRGYENYFKIVCAWRPGENPAVNQLLDVIDSVLFADNDT